jgi:hypothetical protein
MELKCILNISKDGRVARLIHENGLTIATIAVDGPLLRSAEGVNKEYDDGSNFMMFGLADNQYIDERTGKVLNGTHT